MIEQLYAVTFRGEVLYCLITQSLIVNTCSCSCVKHASFKIIHVHDYPVCQNNTVKTTCKSSIYHAKVIQHSQFYSNRFVGQGGRFRYYINGSLHTCNIVIQIYTKGRDKEKIKSHLWLTPNISARQKRFHRRMS